MEKKKYSISFQVENELVPDIEASIKDLGCTKNAFYEFAIRLLLLKVDPEKMNVWQNQAFKAVMRKYSKGDEY